MRFGRVGYMLGWVSVVLGVFMALPLITDLFYPEERLWPMFVMLGVTLVVFGTALRHLCYPWRRQVMRQRDSYIFVSAAWVLASLVGAIPYLLTGCFSDVASAVFESASGFSTTGASAIVDVEVLPHALLMWRSLTHWLGGAGFVMMFMMMLQRREVSGEGRKMLRAEFSGGGSLPQRVGVRVEENARAVFTVYLALTAACLVSFYVAGMGLFDAINHALATVSTAGFSTKNASIGAFNSPAIEWVGAVFLFLSSINFSLYYLFFVRGRRKKVLADQELHTYIAITAVATILVSLCLYRDMYTDQSFLVSLRHGFFQTITIISSGGFCTTDFDLWPHSARLILFVLVFVGGCAGSTSSGPKLYRWRVAVSAVHRELSRAIRPTQVSKVYFNGRPVEDSTLLSVALFFVMYFGLILAGSVLMALTGMDWMEAFTSTMTSISNVGPAYGSVGPGGNFSAVSDAGKYILSFLMIAGRLELFAVLVLFLPATWRD